ncbi:MAG TPA: hypothetical protein VK574_16165 [Terracidiphilus sp.]|jgi:hypothetical protein|nr:hypothetical protein [Terracidiphilus sp.]
MTFAVPPVCVGSGGSGLHRSNQFISSSTVVMIDHSEDLRDYIATVRYAQGAAASAADKQKQQHLKNAPGAPPM